MTKLLDNLNLAVLDFEIRPFRTKGTCKSQQNIKILGVKCMYKTYVVVLVLPNK